MRYLRKIKNFILKLITIIAGFVSVFSMMMLDSENIIIPVIAFTVSFIWLVLFAIANVNYVWYWENGEV